MSAKEHAIELLKSLETGDTQPLSYIDPEHYIEHNLNVADGLEGLKAYFASRPKGTVKVNTVRAYEDGDYVVTHSEFVDGQKKRIGFDIFRFANGSIVEHWDNMQDAETKPSPSGHWMTDGPSEVADRHKTADNKALMQRYMDDLIAGRRETFPSFFEGVNYIQHNPWVGDNLTGLIAGLQALAKQGLAVKYDRVHKILGEGNFVLVVAEGLFGDKVTAYYDFYRIENGKLAEHWDTLEAIPPEGERKNSNGKF
ncbi:MAG: nuclear transport factor 2 family protein [Burkholderiaceae bacterium]|jgi:predicted SnoaL-like aldol condensation-catalyzing enzyme